MKWSTYFQNPLFMEMTRKFLIPPELKQMILDGCGASQGMRVLDVGCGTGYFTRFLADTDLKLRITGVDRDDVFIREAEVLSEQEGLSGATDFIMGDAVNLPFESQTFDAVVSHTFLNIVEDPECVMNEMKRVCRQGGVISSITAMSLYPQALCPGFYPSDCLWVKPLEALSDKVWLMYHALDPLENRLNHVQTNTLPRFFHESGLDKITMRPIGKCFSLSDARIPDSDKREYILKMFQAKKQKIDAFMGLETCKKYITRDEYVEYVDLLKEERDFLLKNLHDNAIWQWEGGANLLVSGIVGPS